MEGGEKLFFPFFEWGAVKESVKGKGGGAKQGRERFAGALEHSRPN